MGAPPAQEAALFLDTAPSWEELQTMVEAKQAALDAVPPPLETVRGDRGGGAMGGATGGGARGCRAAKSIPTTRIWPFARMGACR